MKILVVQESDWIKRNPHQQHHLMERLSLRGHEIKVIDFPIERDKEQGLFTRREVLDNYNKIHPDAHIQVIRPSIIQIPCFVYSSLMISHRKEINRQIKEFKPDVIIGFGIINTFLASRIAKKENIPFIYYWIDVLHLLIPEKPFRFLGRYLEKITLKNSSLVITINHELEDYVKNLGANNTKVIGAGVDLEKFNPDLNGSQIRREHGFKDDDIILFFMGFLYHFSGLKEVALELSNNSNGNLKLLIIGDGDAYDDLQKIVDEHELNQQIILAGHKPYSEIPEFMAAADICILPAYPDEKIMQDVVPIKVYEYLAMGKPVISTALPGVMKEFNNENGISYVKDPFEVLKKALNINIDREGEKARKFAASCDWRKITSEFEQQLENVTLTNPSK